MVQSLRRFARVVKVTHAATAKCACRPRKIASPADLPLEFYCRDTHELSHPARATRPPKPLPEARGEGATVFKGRLLDIASIKQAKVIVRQAEMIAAG